MIFPSVASLIELAIDAACNLGASPLSFLVGISNVIGNLIPSFSAAAINAFAFSGL